MPKRANLVTRVAELTSQWTRANNAGFHLLHLSWGCGPQLVGQSSTLATAVGQTQQRTDKGGAENSRWN